MNPPSLTRIKTDRFRFGGIIAGCGFWQDTPSNQRMVSKVIWACAKHNFIYFPSQRPQTRTFVPGAQTHHGRCEISQILPRSITRVDRRDSTRLSSCIPRARAMAGRLLRLLDEQDGASQAVGCLIVPSTPATSGDPTPSPADAHAEHRPPSRMQSAELGGEATRRSMSAASCPRVDLVGSAGMRARHDELSCPGARRAVASASAHPWENTDGSRYIYRSISLLAALRSRSRQVLQRAHPRHRTIMTPTKASYLDGDPAAASPPSESEIYSIARVAYEKLAAAAACRDQDLRRLVGHANLYDKLLDELHSSLSDSDGEEPPAPALSARGAAIHVDATYIYQDQQRADADGELAFGTVLDAGKDDLALCRVASRSGGEACGLIPACVEVELAEKDILDAD
ncbi:hypothetical protein JHW43_001554 [Diplocarpon mali]|nr:hypothetical protein JHW43_001554 [Diplocarpon mali]